MRLSIDGSSLAFPPSGIRTYVSALIREMESADQDIELSVLQPSGQSRPLPERASRFWWDARGVASAAHHARAGVLHVPQFSAPIRNPAPLVVTIHDLIPLMHREYRQSRSMRAYLSVMRRTVAKAGIIIVPSRYVAHQAPTVMDIDVKRVRVIPMAAGPEFSPADHPKVQPAILSALGIRGPYIFNIAGFDVRKNLPCLLQAFATFRNWSPGPYQLVIAGAPHTANPTVFPPVRPVVERLALAEHVIMPGLISEQAKIALYQHAAMYVTPSLSEGFGMTCLEAMSCGTPVIAANCTALPEVVGGGGLLVEPEPSVLAEAMTAVAQEDTIAAQLRRSGIAQAARYSWGRTASMTIDAYRDALDG